MRTALHVAAAEGQFACVDRILKSSVNVGILDRWGSTPLEDAVKGGHATVYMLLKSRGASFNAGFADTLMLRSSVEGNTVMQSHLKKCGASVDCVNYDG